MSLRFLLGLIAPMLSGYRNESVLEKVNTETFEKDFETPVRFHIGMLSISLITGLAFGGYITYKAWEKNNIFLGYIRNLIIALVCRTFFSILFDGIILLGTPFNVKGGNALVVFEQIFLNLVLAFWLTLNIYIHARVQNNFDREPELKLYQYGVPGVAVFFTFIWIFTLQDQVPSFVWWIFLNPFTQWIVNSLNLLFLLIQLALIGDIVRILMKMSLDNDSISLLRYISIMMGVLVFIFWLHFGFILGRAPLFNSSAYLYFHYLIDGLECTLVCLVFYFFSKWVFILLKKISNLMIGIEELAAITSRSSEVLLRGYDDRGIVSTDSVFMTRESKRWMGFEEEGTKDVMYSNVVEPQRLKKTFELYKRFNIIPTNQVTVVEGEEFYDCHMQSSFRSNACEDSKLAPKQLQHLQVPNCIAESEGVNFRKDKIREQPQKKNAFYSSKYLILDSKEDDFPKYLETRPSKLSNHSFLPSPPSVIGKESPKEERVKKNFLSSLDTLMSEELVRKWLSDNSENLQKKKKNKTENNRTDEKEKSKLSKNENLDSEIVSKPKSISEAPIQTENDPGQKENQANMFQAIASTIDSILSNVHFRSSEGNNSGNEKGTFSAPDEIKKIKGEQNDEKKFIESVSQPKIAEFQKEERETSDSLSDALTKTDRNVKPRKNDAQFKTLTDGSDLDTERTTYPESSDIQSQELEPRNEQQLQVSREQHEKLTEFPFKNKHGNDSNFETETDNIHAPLNVKNERKESESLELQICSANNVAKKTENAEITENVTGKPHLDLEIESKSTFSEIVKKSDPMGSIKEAKPENTSLAPSVMENSNKSTESLNQYLTYSELLNYRLQQNKEISKQPSFSFSDAICKGISSLINASGSFFFPGKNFPNKETLQEVEPRESKECEENLVPNSYQTPQDKINDKPQINNNAATRKAEDEGTEISDSKSAFDFQISEDISVTTDIVKEQISSSENNMSTLADEIDFSQPLQFQSQQDEPTDLHSSKDVEKINDIENFYKTKLPSKSFETTQEESISKNKTLLKREAIERQARKTDKPKSLKKLNAANVTESEINSKQIQKPYLELFKQSEGESCKATTLQKNQTNKSETSSDSEFSIEKKKVSYSSDESFSLDRYYTELMNVQKKFQNPTGSVQENQTKRKNKLKQVVK